MRSAYQRWVARLKAEYRMPIYNVGYRLIGSLDGYPLPPSNLVQLVIGTKELAWYQLGGLFMHQAIAAFLRKNGRPIESFRSILDFGCGCGRIIRWWAALRHQCEIWGTDYNPDLIAWCQKELSSMAQFQVNQANPRLDFEDKKFEFVYSYSVFTHFSMEQQQPWFAEMARILKPGGILLLTVHGERVALRSGFSEDLFRQLESDGIVIFAPEQRGSNMCSAYHSEKYMRNLDKHGLALVDYLAGGVRDASEQDMYLYRKVD